MGFDRGVLPKDRDRDETFPWMGLVVIVVIVGGFLLLILLAAMLFAVEPEPAESSVRTRIAGRHHRIPLTRRPGVLSESSGGRKAFVIRLASGKESG